MRKRSQHGVVLCTILLTLGHSQLGNATSYPSSRKKEVNCKNNQLGEYDEEKPPSAHNPRPLGAPLPVIGPRHFT